MKLLFTAFLFLTASVLLQEASSAFFALPTDWRNAGEPDALFRAELTTRICDGARAQALVLRCDPLPPGKMLRDAGTVRQSIEVNAADFGVLSFKAKFASVGKTVPSFILTLTGPGYSMKKRFSPADKTGDGVDGYLSFHWELKSGKITSVTFSADPQYLKTGDSFEAAVIDFVFERTAPVLPEKPPVEPSRWIPDGIAETVTVPLIGWKPENSADGAAVTVENTEVSLHGKKVPALVLTYVHGDRFTPVSLPFRIAADRFNVFTFKARVETPPEANRLGEKEAPLTGWYSFQFNKFYDNFGISMREKDGIPWCAMGVPSTHFLQHLEPKKADGEGFYTFVWDMKNQNRTGNKGFDLSKVAYVQFFYDNRKLKPGEQVRITILDPKFESGRMKSGGDMDRWQAFRKYIENCRPDYSDSARFLGAPEKGRLPVPLPLVKEGRPAAEIVGQSSPWNPEGNAVRELYRWLFRLSGGAALPVNAKPSEETSKTRIFVGRKFAEKLFPEDISALAGSDGCAVRTQGNSIYIFGASPKGTLNGIYTFLENNSDIIWPRPSDLFGAVYTENPNLSAVWGNDCHRAPARNWGWMGKTSGPQFDYQVRNRCNYLGLRSSVDFRYWGLFMEEGGGHNLHSWIPFSLWKTHPEYWCLIDGKRQHPNAYKNQICLSNPEGKKIFVGRWLDFIEHTPQAKKADCLNLKIEDNWGSCECPECLRPIRLPDGSLLHKDDIAFRSTEFFLFLNEVANTAHNRGYPNLQIGTYVYFFTVPVPKIPVSSYIRPYFCDYVRKDQKQPIFAPINDLWWRTLNEWTKVSKRVVIREYTGLYVYFRPLAEVAAWDIRAELDAGAMEFTSESLPECSSESDSESARQFDVSAMEYWVITRLYWDPGANVENLRKYFLRRTFREAAPDMEKFYGTIRTLYFAEPRTSDFEENHETLRLVIASGKLDELRGYLKSAREKVKHPVSGMMVGRISDHFETWVNSLLKESAK